MNYHIVYSVSKIFKMKSLPIIALIPARNGSIGIKNKNIVYLKNKHLIEYSFLEATKSKLINKVFLSTNDHRVIKIKKKYKKIEIILRNKQLSNSSALLQDVLCDSILTIKKNLNLKNFNLILLQPTSPLRKVKDINNAILLFKKDKKSKTLASVSTPINHPYEFLYYENHKLKKLINSKKNTNRQNLKKFFFVNGNIYILDANEFLKKKIFIDKNTKIFKMDKKFSLELDDYDDLKMMKGLMNDL